MRYEYKVATLKGSVWSGKVEKLDHTYQSELNQFGMLGWELVGVTPYGTGVKAFLKREK